MPKNALFYNVSMKNGHQEWGNIVPAQSTEHAKSLFVTPDIAVTNITCLGWCPVEVDWDGSDVVFRATPGGYQCHYEPGTIGYDYLINYFHVEASRILREVRESYNH